MKKLLLTLSILSVFFVNAQENPIVPKVDAPKVEVPKVKPFLLANLSFGTILHSSDEIHYQFLYEKQVDISQFKESEKCDNNHSDTYKLSYISKNVTINSQTFSGYGFEVCIGEKQYMKKNLNKLTRFYVDTDLLNYSRIYFSDKNYTGLYEFFKIPIIPNVGYKFVLGKAVTVDISAGMRYKIEIKGRGDVDNNHFSEIDFNAGFRLGYQF